MLVPVLKQDLSPRIKSLEFIRYVTITYKSISNVCLSTPWKGKEQLFGGSKLCIFFFFINKLLHLHPSKCWTKATYRITPETTEIVFHWLCLVFLPFLSVRESWVCTSWWVARQPQTPLSPKGRVQRITSRTSPWALSETGSLPYFVWKNTCP